MASSDGPKADPLNPSTLRECFYESHLTDLQCSGKEAENELTTKLYKSMVGYVVDRIIPLSLHSTSDDTSPATEKVNSETANGECANGVQIEYGSGNVFEGQVSMSMPHGNGRLFLKDCGVTYQGQFRDGLPDGCGTIRWSDGSWYEGEFRVGVRHGRGLYVSAEHGRRRHGGQWVHGKRHGPGETTCPAGDGALDYSGDWADGRPHGCGAVRWPDGTRYDGGWARGLPHGRGRAAWPDGDVYDGDWIDGHMDGTGAYEWKSNPDDSDRLVLCLCDRYSGQWSRSRKHGPGVFYSSETGATVRGHWVDDALDGPCEIVLSDGRRPDHTGLRFRRNVLYGIPAPAPPSKSTRAPKTTGRKRTEPAASSFAPPSRRPPIAERPDSDPEWTTPSFRWPCERPIQRTVGHGDGRDPGGDGAGLVRVNVRMSAADGWTACDLTRHVRKTAAARAEYDVHRGPDDCGRSRRPNGHGSVSVAADPESELRDAESMLRTHANRLQKLYRAYGAFLADGPVDYQPLMTRLGLWQMIIDSGLHARVSLADLDDSLYENGDYAFGSAHDPFEPVYPWQFIHAVCELAIAVARDDARQEDCPSSVGGKILMFASAVDKLITEHLSPDNVVQPKSYATAVDGSDSWTNSRKTIARMYDVYLAMTATAAATDGPPPPPPTARLLIRLYGPRATGRWPPPPPASSMVAPPPLDSVLPAVLDAVFATRDEQTDGPGDRAPGAAAAVLFECSVRSVVALLSEACPRIADRTGAAADDDNGPTIRLVDVETRLTFAEWYRFVLLCVRRCDDRPAAA